jgi:hypothetical protein
MHELHDKAVENFYSSRDGLNFKFLPKSFVIIPETHAIQFIGKVVTFLLAIVQITTWKFTCN